VYVRELNGVLLAVFKPAFKSFLKEVTSLTNKGFMTCELLSLVPDVDCDHLFSKEPESLLAVSMHDSAKGETFPVAIQLLLAPSS
jgi:hypothetical protein